MEATDLRLAFDQGEDRGFRRDLAFPVAGFAADVGFVGLDYIVLTTERPAVGINSTFTTAGRYAPG
jgi:hypothetical protein